jgi:hypothetical protein
MPTEGNRELVLPWHEPLPLSKAVYACGWRFMGKLFFGLGFAATLTVEICSGFARAAIADSVIAAWSVEDMRGAGNIVPPTDGISRAKKGGWITATASAPIVAAGSRVA